MMKRAVSSPYCRGPLLGLFVLAAMSACDLTSGPTSDRRMVGIIEWQPAVLADAETGPAFGGSGGPGALLAPDTAVAGVPFKVRITTVGFSGCWMQDGAETSISGNDAVVTPYDLVITRIDGDPASCTGELAYLPRDVQLIFVHAGLATLQVHGRRVTDGDPNWATPATVEKQIVVR